MHDAVEFMSLPLCSYSLWIRVHEPYKPQLESRGSPWPYIAIQLQAIFTSCRVASFLLLLKFRTLLTIICQELIFMVNMGALEHSIMLGSFRIYEPVKKNLCESSIAFVSSSFFCFFPQNKSPKYTLTIGAHLALANFACSC